MVLWQFWTLIGVLVVGFGLVLFAVSALHALLLDYAVGVRSDLEEHFLDLERCLDPMEDIGVWAKEEARNISASKPRLKRRA